MSLSSLIPILYLVSSISGFQIDSPSIIKSKDVYNVDSIQSCPESFIKYIKSINVDNDDSSQNKEVIRTVSTITESTTSSTHSQTQTQTSSAATTTFTLSTGIELLQADSNEEAYFLNVTIDDNQYNLLVDTGTPYLWIYDSSCTDLACTSDNQQLFTPTSDESTTDTFNLAYSSGSAQGIVVHADIDISDYLVSNFSFGSASTVPDIFQPYDITGVLGLPSAETSVYGLTNIVSTLKSEDVIDYAKFTLCLGTYESELTNYGLFIVGNQTDSTELYIDDIYYADLLVNSTSTYWEIVIENFYIDDYQVEFSSLIEIDDDLPSTNKSRISIIDSGTTSIIASKDDAITIHSFFTDSITDGSNYAIYCNSTLDLKLEIGGHNWTLTPSEYIGEAYSESSDYYGYCVSNIVGLDVTDNDSWILGALFLKTVFAEFDFQEKKVGLAKRNENIYIVESTEAQTVVSSTVEPTAAAAADLSLASSSASLSSPSSSTYKSSSSSSSSSSTKTSSSSSSSSSSSHHSTTLTTSLTSSEASQTSSTIASNSTVTSSSSSSTSFGLASSNYNYSGSKITAIISLICLYLFN